MKAPNLEKRVRGQRLGLHGYLFALREIHKAPRTAEYIAQVMSLSRENSTHLMRRLRAARLIHIGGWVKAERANVTKQAVFVFGAGDDVPYPSGSPFQKAERATTLNAAAIAAGALLRALSSVASKHDVREFTGMTHMHSNNAVNYMHSIGLIHIAAWSPQIGGGTPIALYVLGQGRDAARPKPESRGARVARRKAALAGRAEMLTMIHATAANADRFQEAA